MKRLICWMVEAWYFVRYPTGLPISGHDYEEKDGRLVCRDCGKVSD